MRVETFGDQIKEAGELGEDQRLLAFIHAGFHQFGDGSKLGRLILGIGVQQPWITADLAQLGQLGEDANLRRVEIGFFAVFELHSEPLLVGRIQFALFAGKLHGQRGLQLVRQIGQHLGLQPALDEHAHQRLQLARHPGGLRIDLCGGPTFGRAAICSPGVGDGQLVALMESLV